MMNEKLILFTAQGIVSEEEKIFELIAYYDSEDGDAYVKMSELTELWKQYRVYLGLENEDEIPGFIFRQLKRHNVTIRH